MFSDRRADFDLIEASRSGTLADVQEAIDAGEDVNGSDSQGMSPLHLAASRGAITIIKLLHASGADLNATDRAGMTPLHAAVVHDRIAAVEELSAAGCKVDVSDIRGFTPLHHAVSILPISQPFTYTPRVGALASMAFPPPSFPTSFCSSAAARCRAGRWTRRACW